MELKHTTIVTVIKNRCVLIVPFMELKLMSLYSFMVSTMVLIVPFMELKRNREKAYNGAQNES